MEVEKSDLAKKEEEILKFWQEHKIFEATLAKPSPKGEFVFYEGPPTANGRPAIHHLAARAFKDLIPRFKTMQGYHVRRKAGWDTHGLPVELEVEKKLGLKSKKEIETYGIEKFNQACRENVWQYLAEWQKFTSRIGFWVDQEQPYITYAPTYMESVWWIIKEAAARGFLYRDYKVVPWCPRCGTALSSHELAQGYAEVTDQAVYVKFKVKNPVQHNLPTNTFLLAWTTTPWTLPGNVALAVGEKIEYVLFKQGDQSFIAASGFASLTPSDPTQSGVASRVDQRIPTSQLIGLEYEPLFNFPNLQNEKSHRVYAADFVSTEEGTGIVHTAVMYGADDFDLGTKVGLPKYHLVAEDGKFKPEVNNFAGQSVKEANPLIIEDLTKRNLIFKVEPVKHTYPFCWRCKTALIYYARDSWYFKMSSLRAELLTANEGIDWTPEHIKAGRFGEWLGEVKDWAISRERYWGTPLPIWQSASGERLVIGSVEELKQRIKKSGNQYFVMRHGEAENNVLGVLSSRSDNPHHLTPKGQDQVSLAAESLKGGKIDLIVSSDFVRTKETAELVAKVIGLDPASIVYDHRLGETNHGDFNGQSVEIYNQQFKGKPINYEERPTNGENYADVKKRMGEALYDLEVKYQNKKILIISHESPIWLLFAAAFGFDVPQTISLRGTAIDFLKNAEVKELAFVPLPHNADYELDLHRPFIDRVELVGDNGELLTRVPEVLDVWFDSGAMPFAQDHHPFDFAQGKPSPNEANLLYPADYISEAMDQTRGWFYTLLAISTLLGRPAPYRHVVCLGLLLDAKGKKMSKSVGNVVDPNLMMDRYGVDALRFWMYSVSQPGEAKNFDELTVAEVGKKFINPLLNVVTFYKLYAKDSPPVAAPASTHLLDEWLLTLFSKLVEEVTAHLEHYRITEAARALKDFVTDLSQWYVRRSRDRFKSGEVGAVETLGYVLNNFTRLLAPFMPFLTEDLYQSLNPKQEPVSIHLTAWPESDKRQKTNDKLLEEMNEVRLVASLALEARARAKVKVRQPLAALTVRGKAGHLSTGLEEIIKEEVNVKDVRWVEDLETEVALDTTLTPELVTEGRNRELVRHIQDLRKLAKLTPGQLVPLSGQASVAGLAFIDSQAESLKTVTSLSQIKLTPLTKAEDVKLDLGDDLTFDLKLEVN